MSLRRWLLTSVALSLSILWIGLVAAWVRSYWRGDTVIWQLNRSEPVAQGEPPMIRSRNFILFSGGGGMGLVLRTIQSQIPPTRQSGWDVSSNPTYPQPWVAPVAMSGRFILGGGRLTFRGPVSAAGSTAGRGLILPVGSSGTLELSGAISDGAGAVTVTHGTWTAANGAGSISVNAGDEGTALFPSKRGSTLRGVQGLLVLNSVLPLPPPSPLPPAPGRFFGYEVDEFLGSTRVVIFPYWAAVLGLSLPMLFLMRMELRAIRRRVWVKRGMCRKCGYDLRASPQRCPECGTEVLGGAPGAPHAEASHA